MSKLSGALLESMDRFAIDDGSGEIARPLARRPQDRERSVPVEYADALKS
jgi:hypothetical protein